MQQNSQILLSQSFVMDKAGSYWDYRDYIFSLCSNPTFKNQPIRLNVERGVEWADEMSKAAAYNGFTDFNITQLKPESWSSFVINQIDSNPTIWTMPFPGDHIYIEEEDTTFKEFLKIGEDKNVDAISFGHIQDWDYLLDWKRIEIIENSSDYIIIKWGHKFRYCRNYTFSKMAQGGIKLFLMMPPVPGFMIFKSGFLRKILEGVPNAHRWQDMEYSNTPVTWSYKVLIPKKYLYRHVHGYWIEQAFEILSGRALPVQNTKETLDKMYIRTKYNWETNTPNRVTYRGICIQRANTMNKYIKKNIKYLPEVYSPFFNNAFSSDKTSPRKIQNFLLLNFIDYPKNIVRNVLYELRK